MLLLSCVPSFEILLYVIWQLEGKECPRQCEGKDANTMLLTGVVCLFVVGGLSTGLESYTKCGIHDKAVLPTISIPDCVPQGWNVQQCERNLSDEICGWHVISYQGGTTQKVLKEKQMFL